MQTNPGTSPLPNQIPQAAFDDLWETTDRLAATSRDRCLTAAGLVGQCRQPHDLALAEAFLANRVDLVPSHEGGRIVYKAGMVADAYYAEIRNRYAAQADAAIRAGAP